MAAALLSSLLLTVATSLSSSPPQTQTPSSLNRTQIAQPQPLG